MDIIDTNKGLERMFARSKLMARPFEEKNSPIIKTKLINAYYVHQLETTLNATDSRSKNVKYVMQSEPERLMAFPPKPTPHSRASFVARSRDSGTSIKVERSVFFFTSKKNTFVTEWVTDYMIGWVNDPTIIFYLVVPYLRSESVALFPD